MKTLNETLLSTEEKIKALIALKKELRVLMKSLEETSLATKKEIKLVRKVEKGNTIDRSDGVELADV